MSHLMVCQGDAAHLPFEDKTFHCCITSPPYYGLRAYEGLRPTVWPGGSYCAAPGSPPTVLPGPLTWEALAQCEHVWATERVAGEIGKGNWAQGVNGRGEVQPGGVAAKREPIRTVTERATCQRCGAWLGTLGNEETPAAYLFHLLLVLREIRRVLRDDGTLWLNIGDCYSQDGKWGGASGAKNYTSAEGGYSREKPTHGYPAGTLLGIPAQFHMAAIADGWICRNDVVWKKDAPMPESIRGSRHEKARCKCAHRIAIGSDNPHRRDGGRGDVGGHPWSQPDPACPSCHGTGRLDTLVLRRGSWRHTRSHEFLFMLTKTIDYWADGEAVKEKGGAETGWNSQKRRGTHKWTYTEANSDPKGGGFRGKGGLGIPTSGTRNPRSVLIPPPTPADALTALVAWLQGEAPAVLAAYEEALAQGNPGSVVSPSPSPFSGAHFATFPESLVIPLIKSSCPAQCCPVCGAGFAPVITSEGGRDWHQDRMKATGLPGELAGANGYKRGQSHEPLNNTQRHTIHAYLPTCTCVTALPPAPGICLDPFGGAGTVGLVARALRRNAVLLEASATYVQLSRERLGITDLHDWLYGEQPTIETFDTLPLFAGDLHV